MKRKAKRKSSVFKGEVSFESPFKTPVKVRILHFSVKDFLRTLKPKKKYRITATEIE